MKYLNHDEESGEKNKPVNFNWQVVNWPIKDETLNRLSIKLEPGLNIEKQTQKQKFIINEAPEKKPKLKREGVKKDKFRQLKVYNNPETDKKLKDIGNKGEQYIIEYEIERLTQADKAELADKIKHISLVNDAAGYDILSFNEDGSERYIEVKTTKGPIGTDFFISPGEIKFSKANKEYYIYRVFEFLSEKMTGKIYIKKGDVEINFNLTPLQFKASL